MNETCALCHSLDSESAAGKLTIPALVEVNLSGETTKSGVAPESLAAFLELYPNVSRADDDAAVERRPGVLAPVLRTAARACREPTVSRALDGDEPGLPRRRRGGRDLRASRLDDLRRPALTSLKEQEPPPTAVTFRATMSFADVWNKTLVYFGIAEEEEWDEDGYLTDEELQRAYAERPNVRRLAPRRSRREDFDDWTDPEEAASRRTSVLRPAPHAGSRSRGGSAESRACRPPAPT